MVCHRHTCTRTHTRHRITHVHTTNTHFLKNKRLVKQIQEIKDPRVKYEMYENVYHLIGKISYYKKSIFEYSVNYSVAEVVMPSEWRVFIMLL